MKSEVIAVCLSEKKGIQKHEVPEIDLVFGHGIEGDAHAGNWHRQVSLLADESVDKMRALGKSEKQSWPSPRSAKNATMTVPSNRPPGNA